MGKETSRIETPEQIRELAALFRKSRILLSAFELGVFTAVGDRPVSSAETAAAITADPRGTDRLMNALCSLGLLARDGELFRNTPAGLRYLVKTSPDYLSGLGHSVRLYRRWGTLSEAVRTGGAVPERDPAGYAMDLDSFIGAMHQRARNGAGALAAALDLSGVASVLDVGGGSAVYSLVFAGVNGNLRAVVFDLPAVTPITEGYIKAAELQDPSLKGRVTVKQGNFLHDDFGGGYDLILLSAIVHMNSFEENRSLAARCFKSLNPGGRIVIQDHVMAEDRSGPPEGTFFALNMLVNTPGGDTYTESEITSWLKDAGCTEVRKEHLGPGSTLMIGRKGR